MDLWHRPDQLAASADRPLMACAYCDCLQHEVPLQRNREARCVRCRAVLYRGTRSDLDTLIALASSGPLLLLLSNLFPIASLAAQGIDRSTTLAGTALALDLQGRTLVALLVVVTTILVPALQLALLLYALVPLRLGRMPPAAAPVFRLLVHLAPWSMMEVFLLGTLVTLVKLRDVATVVPGASLWAFAILMLLFAAISARINRLLEFIGRAAANFNRHTRPLQPHHVGITNGIYHFHAGSMADPGPARGCRCCLYSRMATEKQAHSHSSRYICALISTYW